MKNRKKILITGSSGFIGSNLKKYLSKKYDVYGIGRKKIIEKNYYKLDIKKQVDVRKFFKNNSFDLIIHCAWYTKHNDYRNSKINYNYLKYSKFILDNFIKNGGKYFIGIGTCEEYQQLKNKRNYLKEHDKIKPINNYAKAKNLFHIYLKGKKINYKWLRIFYLFGEGEDKNRLIPSYINSSKTEQKFFLNNPNFRIDFLYVKTLVKIIDRLINKKISGDFNICSGKSIKILSILNTINNFLKKDIKKNIFVKSKNKKNEEILGSINKLKKFNCYINSNLKKDIIKYFKSSKNI